MSSNPHDLLKFIFGDSQADADFVASLNEATERHASKKTPLIKALKELGINTENMKVDESGCWITMTDSDAYHAVVKALGSVEAVNGLADHGWVVSFSGDVADTTELPEYTLNFLCLDEPNVSELDKPVTVAQLNKDFEAGSDVVPNDVAEAVNAMLEDADNALSGITSKQVQAIMDAGRALEACATGADCVTPAKAFIDAIVAARIAFHPEQPFSDYVDTESDRRLFTDEEAALLDSALDRAMALEDFDLYDYAMRGVNRAAFGHNPTKWPDAEGRNADGSAKVSEPEPPPAVMALVTAAQGAGMDAEILGGTNATVMLSTADGSTFEVSFHDGVPESVIATSVSSGNPSDDEGAEALDLIKTNIPAFITRFKDW